MGAPGPKGPTGELIYPPFSLILADKGLRGDRGFRGIEGPVGLTGPPGLPGQEGLPGWKGEKVYKMHHPSSSVSCTAFFETLLSVS
jgi:hypothetical protein